MPERFVTIDFDPDPPPDTQTVRWLAAPSTLDMAASVGPTSYLLMLMLVRHALTLYTAEGVECSELTFNQIAPRLGVKPRKAEDALDRLVRFGLVEQVTVMRDRPGWHVRISAHVAISRLLDARRHATNRASALQEAAR